MAKQEGMLPPCMYAMRIRYARAGSFAGSAWLTVAGDRWGVVSVESTGVSS
ncbi:hypothetical protein ABWJ92_28890 [Streptomyces sp. NPDC000609]|uniref:hypothetical protein n=1 Tax=Streptomyces sp. NPDC000609 TaxID=3160957 RepID=UPI003393B610